MWNTLLEFLRLCRVNGGGKKVHLCIFSTCGQAWDYLPSQGLTGNELQGTDFASKDLFIEILFGLYFDELLSYYDAPHQVVSLGLFSTNCSFKPFSGQEN